MVQRSPSRYLWILVAAMGAAALLAVAYAVCRSRKLPLYFLDEGDPPYAYPQAGGTYWSRDGRRFALVADWGASQSPARLHEYTGKPVAIAPPFEQDVSSDSVLGWCGDRLIVQRDEVRLDGTFAGPARAFVLSSDCPGGCDFDGPPGLGSSAYFVDCDTIVRRLEAGPHGAGGLYVSRRQQDGWTDELAVPDDPGVRWISALWCGGTAGCLEMVVTATDGESDAVTEWSYWRVSVPPAGAPAAGCVARLGRESTHWHAVSPDGRWLALALGPDGRGRSRLRVYDARDPGLRHNEVGLWESSLCRLSFSPDGETVVAWERWSPRLTLVYVPGMAVEHDRIPRCIRGIAHAALVPWFGHRTLCLSVNGYGVIGLDLTTGEISDVVRFADIF
jgi:hypothetical protein